MVDKKHTSLLLPLIAIGMLIASMTQGVKAASWNGEPEVQSITGISEIDDIMDRVEARRVSRKVQQATDDDKDTIIPRSSRSSSSRSSSVSSRRSSARSTSSATITTTLSEFRREVVRLVNVERSKAGLKAYTYNSTLEKSGQDYAVHMQSTNCFSHTECGSTLKERMHASGYYAGGGKSYSYGENIARGQDTAAEVMEDWMNSPSHKAAILSTKYLEIGIGKSGNYWVQHFGAIR